MPEGAFVRRVLYKIKRRNPRRFLRFDVRMPRVFWMKMSCKKVFSMTYFIQINFIKNDLNKNVLNKKRRGRCFIAYVRFSLRIKNVILY